MSSSISISLVINFDSKKNIQNIISKFKQSEIESEIVLVDNGDQYRDYLANDNRIKYIYNDNHIGYANAHNLSFKFFKKTHKYHLYSNVDLDIDYNNKNDVLSILYKFMEKNKHCSIVGPKIISSDNQIYDSCKLLPNPMNLLFGKFSKKLDYKIGDYSINLEKVSDDIHIPFISGCFLFCRKKTLHEVNYMDGNLFLFMDDVDLCRRVGEKSKIFYCKEATIMHEHGRIHTQNIYLNYIAVRSIIYYFNKFGWFFDNVRSKLNKEVKINTK